MIKLLKQLYAIHSPSNKEGMMVQFICNWLTEKNIPFSVDQYNNILATKDEESTSEPEEEKTFPIVVCHTDQVQGAYPNDMKVKQEGDVLYGFIASRLGQVGLGADDKNGILVALKCLEKTKRCKAAFFVGEEIGCVGSSKVDMSFFSNARFVIQCDRRNGSDFITEASGVPLCTEDFMQKMQAAAFGYKKTYGMMTDVMELRRRGLKVCCCNLSCGYYEPHTKHEVTRISELRNCLAMVLWACKNITEVCPMAAYTPRVYSYTGADYYRSTYRPASTYVGTRAATPKAATATVDTSKGQTRYMDKPWLYYGTVWTIEDAYKAAQACHAPQWILNTLARVPNSATTLTKAAYQKILTDWEVRNILDYIDDTYNEYVDMLI